MNTDSFIVNIKTEDVCVDIASDVEKRFDTSNYEIEIPLQIDINKKVLGLMKDGLSGKIVKEFVELRPKTYSYLIHDSSDDKKDKVTKKYITK